MKTRKTGTHENGEGASHNLAAKAATARHLADVAKKHFKMLKAEYKQARKAYRQAKKAAKRARKEAPDGMELHKSKLETARHTNDMRKTKRGTLLRKTHTRSTAAIPLPNPITASVSTATA